MRVNFKIFVAVTLAALCVAFTSCPIENREIDLGFAAPWGRPEPASITVDGTANGWFENSVHVTVTLVNGIITDVDIDVSAETQLFAAPVPGRIAPLVLEANAFNFPVNVVSMATATGRGVARAGALALLEVPGVTEEDITWVWEFAWTAPPADTN